MTTAEAARNYLQRGWFPVPIPASQKRPLVANWQNLRLTAAQCEAAFRPGSNVGLILGEPSGWLVDVDLDCAEALELADQFLPPTEAETGREGRPRSHRWYVAVGATTHQRRDPAGNGSIVELRSTGGQTVVGPSTHPEGGSYELLTGEPTEVDAGELQAAVDALADAVIAIRHPEYIEGGCKPVSTTAPREHDSSHLELRASRWLEGHPPSIQGCFGSKQLMSAVAGTMWGFRLDAETTFRLIDQVFSPRCQPAWSEKEIRHTIESSLKKPPQKQPGWLADAVPDMSTSNDEDGPDFESILSQNKRIEVIECTEPEFPPEPKTHQQFPSHLLEIPGYCSEFVAHCMECAPYPSQVLAFAGALAGLAFLTGRKIRDPADNRTNIYLLGLAAPGVGKDFARKLNKTIAQKVNLSECVGEQIASGEGLMDQLWMQPCMLYQTDEIDTMLQSISKSKDARYESMIAAFLNLYSSANSFVVMRSRSQKETSAEQRKDKKKDERKIENPCLVLYGTAIPENYYSALNERMLTNGFFARTIVMECAGRGLGQEPKLKSPPERLLATASYWASFGDSELAEKMPEFRNTEEVPYSPDALGLLGDFRRIADQEWIKADNKSDRVAQTVWARANEQTRKLALLYAASENHVEPVIGGEAVTWAHEFVSYQIQQMLRSVENHSAANPFHEMCLKVKNRLRDGASTHRVLMRRMKISGDEFKKIMETLVTQEDVTASDKIGIGKTVYKLNPERN